MIRKNIGWLLVALSLLLATTLFGQLVTSVHTQWDDSFADWILFDQVSETEGTLTVRWRMNDDWSAWDYRMGEISGSIQLKWKDNPEEWEVTGDNKIVLINTIWPGDFSQWRIRSDEKQYVMRSKYTHRYDEWEVKTRDQGVYSIQTEYLGDPRDWIIDDQLSEDISFQVRMAFLFIAIYHGTPRL